ncbi:hypothetical protein FYJ43_09455 [Cutibacterium sp. WCA-380-WT-3A]|uniref:Uncharacterized protein n=1 Tax=Cutibacterium porci TaxID=2605781 RepID=A0A7K0J8F7_9ACTN|nr:hypothetical protein [Cutibacterium porci]MSS46242.1 hypothetical protein [Cutibacterium porci]
MLAAAAGIGGTLLVQHHDDELQPNDVAIAAYFAEAISTPDTIDNNRIQGLIAPNTGWDDHSKKAEQWGQAIFKAYHDDKAGPNEGILISAGPLPTRSADIYSRSTAEPIMTVIMTPVDEKWLVDWNATVRANSTPPPPLPSHR